MVVTAMRVSCALIVCAIVTMTVLSLIVVDGWSTRWKMLQPLLWTLLLAALVSWLPWLLPTGDGAAHGRMGDGMVPPFPSGDPPLEPDFLISYATRHSEGDESDSGEKLVERITKRLQKDGISVYHGRMVESSQKWQAQWIARVKGAKCAGIFMSPGYFNSKACIMEFDRLKTASHLNGRVMPVVVAPRVREVLAQDGPLGGCPGDDVTTLYVKSEVENGGNWLPRPDDGVFEDDFETNYRALLKWIRKKKDELRRASLPSSLGRAGSDASSVRTLSSATARAFSEVERNVTNDSLTMVAPSAAGAAASPSPTRKADNMTIKACLSECGNLPLDFGFFISHEQSEATANFVTDFATKLRVASNGLRYWNDAVDVDTVDIHTIVRGVAQSAVFVVVLTKSYFQSWSCRLELRTALRLGKPMAVVYEADDGMPGYAPFDKYFVGISQDLAVIKKHKVAPICRDPSELDELVQVVLERAEPYLEQADSAKHPLLLDVSATKQLLALGNTAACYVDLGSGQTVIYLLAIAEDSSFEYNGLFLDNSGCFLDHDKAKRAELRIKVKSVFKKVKSELKKLKRLNSLFEICIGATHRYQKAHNAGGADKAAVDDVEAWFRTVIEEVGLDRVDRGPGRTPQHPNVKFEVLSPKKEAQYEWVAVDKAVKDVFAGSRCNAVLAAGRGSTQVSTGNEFESAPLGLGSDVLTLIADKGVDFYRKSIRKHVRAAFGGIGQQLSSKARPLGLVLISSFYYAARACGVVAENEHLHYRDAMELIIPAQQLLHEYETDGRPNDDGRARDAANVARMLEVLDVVTDADRFSVKVLFVREWTVRGKIYKATWATGKFLTDMLEIKVKNDASRSSSCDGAAPRSPGIAPRRDPSELDELAQDVLKRAERALQRAKPAEEPSALLDPSVTRQVLKLGNAAACYVDLGSGQTVIYLLAIVSGPSLEYKQLFIDTSGCFLDHDKAKRAKLRIEIKKALENVKGELKTLNSMFEICIGATHRYQWATKTAVDDVEAWFRSVITESGLDQVDRGTARTPQHPRVTFEVLSPKKEAQYVWTSVKEAVKDVFAGSRCDAVLAAGLGSVHVSMEFDHKSTEELKHKFAHDDRAGALSPEILGKVSELDVDSYRRWIRKQLRDADIFGDIAERLAERPRPLGLVLISSFYYAARACGVVAKNEHLHYRDAMELIVPAQELLAKYEADGRPKDEKRARDAANVARMLEVLDVVTSGNYDNVKVLIVQEWTVRSKPYKATWATGKFLTDMLEIKVKNERRADGDESAKKLQFAVDTGADDGANVPEARAGPAE